MAVPLRIDALDILPRAPASDVKRLGFKRWETNLYRFEL